MKTTPPSMPHDRSRPPPLRTRIAWLTGRHATRCPPASAGGFLWTVTRPQNGGFLWAGRHAPWRGCPWPPR